MFRAGAEFGFARIRVILKRSRSGISIAIEFPEGRFAMFDTLRYSKVLESAGVSRDQAEAHVKIIAEIVEDDLASKQDLKELEYRLITKLSAILGTMISITIAVVALILKNSGH